MPLKLGFQAKHILNPLKLAHTIMNNEGSWKAILVLLTIAKTLIFSHFLGYFSRLGIRFTWQHSTDDLHDLQLKDSFSQNFSASNILFWPVSRYIVRRKQRMTIHSEFCYACLLLRTFFSSSIHRTVLCDIV